MTKEILIQKLERLREKYEDDPEIGHVQADFLLLEYINDPRVLKCFKKINKLYS